jgi:SAM-dependent methyltransferase
MNDPRAIVREGYEKLGNRYWEWSRDNDPKYRERYLEHLEKLLAPDSVIVELGSGSGIPTAQTLSARHRVVCVDVAKAQLDLVAENAPGARRVLSDMATVRFAPRSVDAVVAFYSIIHVPREDHASVLSSVFDWLRPGGVFVASLGARNNEELEEWIGVPMFWSIYDADTNLAMIRDVGFSIKRSEILENFEDGRIVHFLWVLARKPA